MSIASRRKLWLKLAQTAAPTTPATPATTAPTISGNPTPIGVNSLFSRVIVGWGAENISKIQALTNALNTAVYFLSGGQFDLHRFIGQFFQAPPTNIPDQNLLAIVRYSKWVWDRVLTPAGSNTIFSQALTTQQKTAIINFLISALNQPLTDIPDGLPSQQLKAKIGGDLKSILYSILTTIK
jgi:hypothetical protein